jgi:Family of unknown function (DUF5681)
VRDPKGDTIMTGDYPVGYGRPPKHTQFKKGSSGNPDGRPTSRRNFKTDLIEELGTRVEVNEGGRTRHLTKQQVIVKQLITRCAKGDPRALGRLLPILLQLEEGTADSTANASSSSTVDPEMLARWAKRLLARNASDTNG